MPVPVTMGMTPARAFASSLVRSSWCVYTIIRALMANPPCTDVTVNKLTFRVGERTVVLTGIAV